MNKFLKSISNSFTSLLKSIAMKKYKNLIYSGAQNRKSPLDLFLSNTQSDKPIVVFAHGYKGFKDWGPWDLVGEAFANAGFDFLKFNFSHNGGTVEHPIDFPDLKAYSENRYSYEQEDLRHISDLIERGIHTEEGERHWRKIALIGHSRGGGMAILHAAKNPMISHLATWASVSDIGERFNFDMEAWKQTGVTTVKNSRTGQDMPHNYTFYTDYLENEEELNIENAARTIKIPWLIVHGSSDEAVSFAEAEKLKKWNPKAELRKIPNTGHTFGGSHPWNQETLSIDLKKVVESTSEFFEK